MTIKDSKVDVCFVIPSSAKKAYQELADVYSAIEPPIWAGMLANHCRNMKHKVQILDSEVSRMDIEKSAQEIAKRQQAQGGILEMFLILKLPPGNVS